MAFRRDPRPVGGVGDGDDPAPVGERNGKQRDYEIKLGKSKTGDPQIGVYLLEQYGGPMEIKFELDHVGGPSAGLAFALSIYDKLTPLEYLDFVAGLWGVPRAVAQERGLGLLEGLGLGPQMHTRCEGLSKRYRDVFDRMVAVDVKIAFA